ncbi:MAG: hypothetical protein E7588_04900 [Ruminococcaceae bacterium]|nr:hypothetical protein [Oscillospiraceae bacterium]
MDFRLDINREGDIRILQITDMQTIDAYQRRFPDRIKGWSVEAWVPENNEKNLYSQIRYVVEKSNPDLIIITGDIIYGEFDDAGTSFEEFCNFMDSFKIHWAPVYGNHDNESAKGIEWQNNRFASSEYCFFKKGETFGNGNYTIGIYQKGELQRVLIMLDSHGCGGIGGVKGVHVNAGLRPEQMEWAEGEMKKIFAENPDVPSFMCFHIPTAEFCEALTAAGYQPQKDASHTEFYSYEIGKDVPARPGEFGKKLEPLASNVHIMPSIKACNTDGLFTGHEHKNNFSVVYDGIRFTQGLKTGLYDYHDKECLGGTKITLSGHDFTVEHVYYPLEEK